ncbi:hypothetical protein NA57DRAFT_23593, partial [Rhizodiscina lignyota]
LRALHEHEYKDAMRRGIVADPDHPRALKDAVKPVGICEDMCPELERVGRIVQRDVWAAEAVRQARTGRGYNKIVADEGRMVKKFRRSAAGSEEQLPSDLRPPKVLQRTVNYLIDEVIDKSDFAKVQTFVWDRTRAIRNDFSIQQVAKLHDVRIAIDCFERIVRFHILSLHQMARRGIREEDYSHQQDLEQLMKALYSLMRYYTDFKNKYHSANEAEFRAYYIILAIMNHDPLLDDQIHSLPSNLLNDPIIKTALKLYDAASNSLDKKGPSRKRPKIQEHGQEDWARFWQIVDSAQMSYLMSCCAEIIFNNMRRLALRSIWKGFRQGRQVNVQDWTTEALLEPLRFDCQEDVHDFCQQHGFRFATASDGTEYLDLNS